MANPRYLLLLATRVVPTIVFVDVIRSALVLLPKVIYEPMPSVLVNAELLLVLISGASAIVTVLTGSVTAYAITLVTLVLTRVPVVPLSIGDVLSWAMKGGSGAEAVYGGGIEVPWLGIVGLLLVLAVDSYTTAFRPGTIRFLGLTPRGVARSVAAFVVILAPPMVASIAVGAYFFSLIDRLIGLSGTLEFTPLRALAGSYVTYAAVALLSFLAVVKLMDSVMGVVTPLVVPSRKFSLGVLTDEADLDRAFSPPLVGTILGLATLMFYPAVHSLLFGVLVEMPYDSAVGLPSVLVHTISFLVTSLVVFGSVRRGIVFSSRRGIAPMVLVLSLIYASAVKMSVRRGYDLTRSLVEPDFAGVLDLVGRSYTDYAHYLLSFMESLFRLLGVAP